MRPSSALPKPIFVHSFKMLSVFVSCSVWSSPPTSNPLLQCALCYFVLGIEPRTSRTLCIIDCYLLLLMLFEEIVVSCSLSQYLSQLRLSDMLVPKTTLRSYVVYILCFPVNVICRYLLKITPRWRPMIPSWARHTKMSSGFWFKIKCRLTCLNFIE